MLSIDMRGWCLVCWASLPTKVVTRHLETKGSTTDLGAWGIKGVTTWPQHMNRRQVQRGANKKTPTHRHMEGRLEHETAKELKIQSHFFVGKPLMRETLRAISRSFVHSFLVT
jgi:hypothetical protein